MYAGAPEGSSAMPTATLDVNSLPPEFLQAYMQTVQQDGAGPSTSQEPGSAQPGYMHGEAVPVAGQEPGAPQPGYLRSLPEAAAPSTSQEPGAPQPGTLQDAVPAAGTYQALAAWASHGQGPQDLHWSAASSAVPQPGDGSVTEQPGSAPSANDGLSIQPLNPTSGDQAAAAPGHHSFDQPPAVAHQPERAAAFPDGHISGPPSAPPPAAADDFAAQVAGVLSGGLSIHQLSQEHQQELWNQFQQSQGLPVQGTPFEGRGLTAEQLSRESEQYLPGPLQQHQPRAAATADLAHHAAPGPAANSTAAQSFQEPDSPHMHHMPAAQSLPIQRHPYQMEIAQGAAKGGPALNGTEPIFPASQHEHAHDDAAGLASPLPKRPGHDMAPARHPAVMPGKPSMSSSDQQLVPGVLPSSVVMDAASNGTSAQGPLEGVPLGDTSTMAPSAAAPAAPVSNLLESVVVPGHLDNAYAHPPAGAGIQPAVDADTAATGAQSVQAIEQPDSPQLGGSGADDAFMQSLALEQLEYDAEEDALPEPAGEAIASSGNGINALPSALHTLPQQPAANASQVMSSPAAAPKPSQGIPLPAQAKWEALTADPASGRHLGQTDPIATHDPAILLPSNLSQGFQPSASHAVQAEHAPAVGTTSSGSQAPSSDLKISSQDLLPQHLKATSKGGHVEPPKQSIGAPSNAQPAAGADGKASGKAGASQPAAWKTSINPFTGQPYTYMPTA